MLPRDKARRYAAELKSRIGPNGKRLTDNQINFRIGYLRARQDTAVAYRSWLKSHPPRNSFPFISPPPERTFNPEEAFTANIQRYKNKKSKEKR